MRIGRPVAGPRASAIYGRPRRRPVSANCGTATTVRPNAFHGYARRRVLERERVGGRHAQSLAGEEVDVRRRLGVGNVLRGHNHLEGVGHPPHAQRVVDQDAWRVGREPQADIGLAQTV